MSFINKYSKYCRKFYLTVLGLAIPFYPLLYGASGHQFDPPIEDIVSLIVVIVSFVTLSIYLRIKDRSGVGFNLMKVLVTITLLLNAYGGVRVFLFIVQFDYGDDVSFFIRALSYSIPLLFTFSAIIVLLGVFRKEE